MVFERFEDRVVLATDTAAPLVTLSAVTRVGEAGDALHVTGLANDGATGNSALDTLRFEFRERSAGYSWEEIPLVQGTNLELNGVTANLDLSLLTPAQRTYDFRFVATDLAGNTGVFTAFEGFTGDVVSLDLQNAFDGHSFSNLQFVNLPSSVSVHLSDDLEPVPFVQSGRAFLLASDPNQSIGVTGSVTVDGEVKQFRVDVRPGFSVRGDDRVVSGTTGLALLQQEQRLRYFNFRGQEGGDLVPDGVLDADTQWAIGTFNSVVSGSTHDPQSTSVRLDVLNSLDVPRWVDLATRSDLQIPGFQIASSLSGGEQTERFATDWTASLIAAAAEYYSNSTKDTICTPGLPELPYDPLTLRSASVESGGYAGYHANEPEISGPHHGGMDVDFETQSSNNIESPFFAVWTDASGEQYVSPSEGKIAIFRDGAYQAADPTPDALVDGVRLLDFADPQGPRNAWQNRPVLLALRNAQLLRDNPDPTVQYRLCRVREQIEAILKADSNSEGVVKEIFYNDPRTWATVADSLTGEPIPGFKELEWNGDGVSSLVKFAPSADGINGLNGVFHVRTIAPVEKGLLSTDDGNRLLEGLQILDSRLVDEAGRGHMAKPLPLVGQSLGELLNLTELLNVSLLTPFQNALQGLAQPFSTESILDEWLAQSAGTVGNLSYTIDTDQLTGGRYRRDDEYEIRFNVNLHATRTFDSMPINLGENAATQGIDTDELVSLPGRADLDLQLSFGFDEATEEFFVQLHGLNAEFQIEEENIDRDLIIGILGANAIDSDWHLQAGVAIDAINPDDDSRFKLGLVDELVLSYVETPNQFFRQAITHDRLDVDIPVEASLHSFSTAGSDPRIAVSLWDPLESTCRHASLSIL